MLEAAAVCVPAENEACDPEATTLRTVRNSYDLRGRAVRAAVHAPGSSEPLASSWSTYDALGRPRTTTTDPDPAALPGGAYESAEHLHLLSQTVYDDRGRPTKTVSPDGRAVCTTYDTLDRPVTVRRAASPDTGGAACPAETAGDLVASTVLDVMDRPYKSLDGNGGATYRWYDGIGRLRFVSDGKPSFAPDTVAPVFAGSLVEPTPSTSGWYSEVSYDSSGRPVRERFWGRRIWGAETGEGYLRWTWTAFDNLGRRTRSSVAFDETGVTYYPSGCVEQCLSAPEEFPAGAGASSSIEYGEDGKARATLDPMGRRTEILYDAFGRPYRQLGPAAGEWRDFAEATYDSAGRVTAVSRTTHDPSGNPHVETSARRFDAWGRVGTAIGDPGDPAETDRNRITTFEYDPLDRLQRSVRRWTVADGYTALDPGDRIARWEYDRAGRVLRVRRRQDANLASENDWATTSYGYTRDGQVSSMTDAAGNVSEWTYRTNGLLESMLHPAAEGSPRQCTVVAEHDGNGNPTRIEQRRDCLATGTPTLVFALQYDERNRLVRRDGSIENPPDPAVEFFGTAWQSFSYDDLGRIVKATDYTPPGGDIAAGSENLIVERLFDTGGRLRRENQIFPVGGRATSHFLDFAYEADGFRTLLTYPETKDLSGQTVARYSVSASADALGRLSAVSAPAVPGFAGGEAATVLSYGYSGAKPWQRTQGNRTEARFWDSNSESLWDGLGQLRGLDVVDLDTAGAFVSFRYGHDRVGNRTYEQRLHEPLPEGKHRTRAYRLDLLDRMTGWREGAMSSGSPILPEAYDPTDPAILPNQTDGESWTLDLLGNWTTKATGISDPTPDTYEKNALNQYESVDPDGAGPETPKLFDHDWLGQLRSNQASNQRYVWDLFGRLTKVLDGNGSPIAVYRYDAFNRRVEKRVISGLASDPVTRFVYDGWRAIEERALEDLIPSGQREIVRARYGYGNGLDEVAWMDRDVPMLGGEPDPGGVPAGTNWRRYYLHQDSLGSVVAATEGAREVGAPLVTAERYTYASYGMTTAWEGNGGWSASSSTYTTEWAAQSRISLPYLYTGQRFDQETGLYYYKNRYYDPARGRFLRRDPIGLSGGPNLYEYAGSSPGMATDPMGLATWDPLAKSIERAHWKGTRINGKYQPTRPDRRRAFIPGAGLVDLDGFVGPYFRRKGHRDGGLEDDPGLGDGLSYENWDWILRDGAESGSSEEKSEPIHTNFVDYAHVFADDPGPSDGSWWRDAQAGISHSSAHVRWADYEWWAMRMFGEFYTQSFMFISPQLAAAMAMYEAYQNGMQWHTVLGVAPLFGQARKVVAAARGVIRIPYGTAVQSASRAAGEARQAVEGGATLYRGGTLGKSAGPEGQFWSLENPLSPGYAQRYGTPGSAFDFVETGHLPPGTNFITREAPGLGAHAGGAIEVVVDPGAVSLIGFYMP